MDKQGDSAAPDVDLQSRGHLKEAATLAFVAVFGYYYYTSQAEEGQKNGEELWLFWTVVWLATRLIQLIAACLLLLLLVLVFQQRKILYVPVPPGAERELATQLLPGYKYPGKIQYEDVTIETEDNVKIHGWFLYQPGKPVEVPYTVLYFHGNAGNIAHRIDNLYQMYSHLKYNILIIDYRAYGRSEDGDGPSESGFLKDAKATYRYIVDRMRNPSPDEAATMSLDRILFFGRSIGGAVALRLGAELLQERLSDAKLSKPLQPYPAGFILENTFTNLREMAIQIFGFLKYLRPLLRYPLIQDEWKGDKALQYIAENHKQWCLCLLSGRQDTIVPPQQMDAMHAIARASEPQVLKFVEVPEGGHNDTPVRGGSKYWNAMENFMDKVKATEKSRIAS